MKTYKVQQELAQMPRSLADEYITDDEQLDTDAIRHQKEYYSGPVDTCEPFNLYVLLTAEQADWLRKYARSSAPGPWGPEILLREWAMDELNRRMAEQQLDEVSDV